jgi:hypothetical protein
MSQQMKQGLGSEDISPPGNDDLLSMIKSYLASFLNWDFAGIFENDNQSTLIGRHPSLRGRQAAVLAAYDWLKLRRALVGISALSKPPIGVHRVLVLAASLTLL